MIMAGRFDAVPLAAALLAGLLCIAAAGARAQTVDLKGRLSCAVGGSIDGSVALYASLHYIPELHAGYPLSESTLLDAEASVDAWGALVSGISPAGKVDPHRLWLRCSTERLELRAGLQKIDFGSALLVRPLMWFDRVDPRDPFKLTSGVYGLLGRYVMQDNVNVWLWTLYGNNGTKGIETDATARNTPEFGGRVQLPIGGGEAAATFHHRRAQAAQVVDGVIASTVASEENRIGLDGRWDVGIGIWGEGVLTHRGAGHPADPWLSLATIGADYTFAWGNGLSVTCEHAVGNDGARLAALRPAANMTALAATYPLTALNGVSLMIFHDWRSGAWFRLATLSHTEDAGSVHLLVFRNPDVDLVSHAGSMALPFGGTGVLLLAAFYH
jgi:hypothetical protein